jgi:hypothetical protein
MVITEDEAPYLSNWQESCMIWPFSSSDDAGSDDAGMLPDYRQIKRLNHFMA